MRKQRRDVDVEERFVPVPFFKDVRELLKQTGYIWTPNIMITSGSVGGSSSAEDYFWNEVLGKYPRELEKLQLMTAPDRRSQTTIEEPRTPYEIIALVEWQDKRLLHRSGRYCL